VSRARALAWVLAVTPGFACGLDYPAADTSSGPVIVIRSFAFEPAELVVDPGASITVRNLDGEPHSVTSEAALGDFRPGAASGISFDTGAFATGERTIAIPATAPHGAMVPYFCSVHGAAMPQGQVVVR
jgi:plastocyanin